MFKVNSENGISILEVLVSWMGINSDQEDKKLTEVVFPRKSTFPIKHICDRSIFMD